MSGVVTLLGAGELMSATSHLHRAALARLPTPARPVFLDTTAGFETNVETIVGKAVEYYRHHLQTELRVARYRHCQRASTTETAAAIAEIRAGNLLFAGPGSPVYAVKHWRGTPVWEAILEQFAGGTHVLFASAASIALGFSSLPVYEIYKTGADPYWEEGLDLMGQLGLRLAIVPHFNDNSGGENYDSRFCYMGAKRFDMLQYQLPPDVTILGIDAYTAVTFEPNSETAYVSGQGGLTVIGDGERAHYESGATVPFTALQSSQRTNVRTDTEERVYTSYEFADKPDTRDDFGEIAAYIERIQALDAKEKLEIISRMRRTWDESHSGPAGQEEALVDLVLELRSAMRELKRFDLADRARDALVEMGFAIGDSAEGSGWKRKDSH